MQDKKKISAVVFDWAGTIVDYGSCATMGAFVRLFEKFNIPLSIEQARGPMGAAKLDHIKALLALPEVSQAWEKEYGRQPNDNDANKLYDIFIPMNLAAIDDFSDPIPGAIELFNALKEQGIKIGSTTGYNREIADKVQRLAKLYGIIPDSIICAGDFEMGRPAPFMMYQTFNNLGVWFPWTVIKVDDTPVGIKEGINSGTWTVGVTTSGNEVGLTKAEWDACSEEEQMHLRQKAAEKLKAAGADYIIDSVADLPEVIIDIERKLAVGERPTYWNV